MVIEILQEPGQSLKVSKEMLLVLSNILITKDILLEKP